MAHYASRLYVAMDAVWRRPILRILCSCNKTYRASTCATDRAAVPKMRWPLWGVSSPHYFKGDMFSGTVGAVSADNGHACSPNERQLIYLEERSPWFTDSQLVPPPLRCSTYGDASLYPSPCVGGSSRAAGRCAMPSSMA